MARTGGWVAAMGREPERHCPFVFSRKRNDDSGSEIDREKETTIQMTNLFAN
jgi:hypothetical protein